MVDNGSFKHISVTAPEEDDVVITAGISSSEGGAEKRAENARPDYAPSHEEPKPSAALSREAAAESQKAAAEPKTSPEAISAAPKSQKAVPEERSGSGEKRGEKPDRRPRGHAHHEQTLEDLEPEPMPLTQKLFIIAAVICIIGAFVFYMAFIR